MVRRKNTAVLVLVQSRNPDLRVGRPHDLLQLCSEAAEMSEVEETLAGCLDIVEEGIADSIRDSHGPSYVQVAGQNLRVEVGRNPLPSCVFIGSRIELSNQRISREEK